MKNSLHLLPSDFMVANTWDARMLLGRGREIKDYSLQGTPVKDVVVLVVTVRNIPKDIIFDCISFIGHNCIVDVFNQSISDWNIISRTRIFRVFVGQFSGRQRPSKQKMHVSHLTFLIYNISPFQQTMPSSRKCHEKKNVPCTSQRRMSCHVKIHVPVSSIVPDRGLAHGTRIARSL